MDTLVRLQNWYKINCNGDWEHDNGVSLSTLDNPGWYLIIDLTDTALEKLLYDRQYQNEEIEDNWFHFKVEEKRLIISCGPENLREVLLIFLDDIIPNFADPAMLYEVYLPLEGRDYKLWYLAKGRIITENKLELVEVPFIEYSSIMVQSLGLLDFDEKNMPNLINSFKVGESVSVAIEQMFDGIKLIAIKQ